jgi:type II secretory pathway pseudopilin PulG
VKPVTRQSDKKAAFTIIELLTVMSVIILLIGLLVPALNMVKRFAKKVTQKNQFHSIKIAMETFNAEWEEYPSSKAADDGGTWYCGATRLAEAMVGRDLLGYDPEGTYDMGDLSGRRLYLPQNANAYRLGGFYSGTRLRPFTATSLVLCDVYARNVTYNNTTDPGDPMNGRPVGMPILYYQANTSGTTHPTFNPPNGVSVDAETNIYKWKDNKPLLMAGKPWEVAPPAPESRHSLLDPAVFYQKTWDDKIDVDAGRPHSADSYILVSAGFDGEYGTDDDVFNFGM